jgi:8-oxo-dGTP pyrophosphatase MutT (NUDIX family)
MSLSDSQTASDLRFADAASLRKACVELAADEQPWNHADLADVVDMTQLKAAAVLVGLVPRASGWHVLLTRRTAHMSAHAGQISFPGGRCDPGDVSPMATALRETEEEVGLPASAIKPWGYLPLFATISNYSVRPVLCELAPDIQPLANAEEVDAVFEAPLQLFADPAQCRVERRMYMGRERSTHVLDYQGHRIWGATAAILLNFIGRLRAQSANGL